MDFSLAFVKSKKQFALKNFTPSSAGDEKWIEWREMADHPVQAVIFSDELKSDQEFMDEMRREGRYLAIQSSADLDLSFEQFQNLDHPNAHELLRQIQGGQVLKANLALLEDLFDTLKHLKELYPDDRMSFFEDLWFVLKNNLGAKDLKIIYNDVPDKENNSLVQILVEGNRHPGSTSGEKFAKILMAQYRKYFGPHFEIIEYSAEQYQLAAVASIDQSPLIIMAQVFSLSPLQKALLKSLFNGLQRE